MIGVNVLRKYDPEGPVLFSSASHTKHYSNENQTVQIRALQNWLHSAVTHTRSHTHTHTHAYTCFFPLQVSIK